MVKKIKQSKCVDFIIEISDPKNIDNEKAKKWWDDISVGKNKVWNKTITTDENEATPYFPDKTSRTHENPDLLNRIEANYLNNELNNMLEIGPGYGRETSQFIKRYSRVYTVDIAKAHHEIINNNYPSVVSREYDGVNIPFEGCKFDLVYSCFVLQHVSKLNCINLLNESIRTLRSGGVFIHEFLSGQYCAGTGKDHLSGGTDGMFNNGYYKEELSQIVQELNNIELIECEEILRVNSGFEKGLGNIWLVCKKV